VADAVEVAFHRAARGLVSERTHVLVAVSGGGDSVALLHLLHRFAARRLIDLTVAHLDHALRRGSGADSRFVVRLAASLDLPSIALRRDVRAARRKDESLEEAARRVRRAFLLEAAGKAGADAIATGHTMDDQAETILMRLARGVGPSALAAMAPAGPGPFVKPLLGIERAALRTWLRKRRLTFRDDPSNASLAFDRNRVRRLVIPTLAKALNPAGARHLVEAAARLREDAAYLDALARVRFEAIASRRADVLAVQAPALAALPHVLAARVALIALVAAGCDPRRISSRHVEAVVALASADPGSSLDLPQRIGARRRGVLLEFRPCASPGRS
jgi:tRNA(Ile)-lysidine synthetase-like protein